MNTYRLHAAGKRRREVYLKKLLLGTFTSAVIICMSVMIRGSFASAHGSAAEEPVMHKYYKSIEISAGDTLWDIASEYVGNDDYSDINAYVQDLKEMNHLHSDDIHDSGFLTVAYYDTEFR